MKKLKITKEKFNKREDNLITKDIYTNDKNIKYKR